MRVSSVNKARSQFHQVRRGSPNFAAIEAAAKDAWRHKKIRLYRADSMEAIPLVGAASIDAVIADPPYGSTGCHWDEAVDWNRLLPALDRIMLPTSVLALFASGKFAFDLAHQLGTRFRYELVWEKDRAVGFLDANKRPLRAHEFILISARRWLGSTYEPQRASTGKPKKRAVIRQGRRTAIYNGLQHNFVYRDDGRRHPRSVLRFASPTTDRIHPTQKSIDLMEWLVESYTRPGDLVLDPWSGSGSTALACLRTGRRFIGFERDAKIFADSVKRLDAAVGNCRR